MWCIGQKGYPVVKVKAIGMEECIDGYCIKGCIDGADKRGFCLAEYKTKERAEAEMARFANHIGNTNKFEFAKDEEVEE